MTVIHPTAIVHPGAELAGDVEIGPYTIVEDDVRIGPGCRIGAHVTLASHLRLGERVLVYNYACLGTPSQDLKHRGQISFAEIGNDSIVREFVTVNRGTREGGVTHVGPRCVLMAYSHVAHECFLEEDVILVNAATMGGDVRLGRKVILGGLCGVHQFCRVGAFAIVGANSKLVQDLPPYLMADGHPARPFGPNLVGLRRAGYTECQIQQIRRIYRELFNRHRKLAESVIAIQQEFQESAYAREILEFCSQSTRGIARPRPRRAPPTGDVTEFNGAI